MDLDLRLKHLEAQMEDLRADLRVLRALITQDHPSALNKMRFVAEKVLHALCRESGVAWAGSRPTIESMIGPLVQRGVIPEHVAAHVRTVQANSSPGSHYQEVPLGETHVHVAQTALLEVLEWYYGQSAGSRGAAAGALPLPRSRDAGTAPGAKRRHGLRRATVALAACAAVAAAVVWIAASGSGRSAPAASGGPPPVPTPDPVPSPDVLGTPDWARPAREQAEEARRLRVPVAFENGIGMRFVLIPSGRFERDPEGGSTPADPASRDVVVSRAFYLGVTEVTNAQFRRYAPNHSSGTRDGVSLDGDDSPAVQVGWQDARTFISWLDELDRRSYRLPTEAEWEYACRAGTRSAWSFGDRREDAPRHANFADAASQLDRTVKDLDDGHPLTAPVASYLANPWGLFDMHGNVWEWCEDWYGPYAAGTATDPLGPASGPGRVLRGGAWDASLELLRSSRRHWAGPDGRFSVIGFRLAAALPRTR